MNKEFIIKMLQAKKLEYEAVMEMLPHQVKESVVRIEAEVTDILKEYIMCTYFGNKNDSTKTNTAYKAESDEDINNNDSALKKVKKIKIQ